MKYLCVILLACIFGAVLGEIVNSAIRDVSKVERVGCKGRVLL